MLAWPCNQFGGQEPRPAAAVAEWARREYKASFPILSKVDVNGPKADPCGCGSSGRSLHPGWRACSATTSSGISVTPPSDRPAPGPWPGGCDMGCDSAADCFAVRLQPSSCW